MGAEVLSSGINIPPTPATAPEPTAKFPHGKIAAAAKSPTAKSPPAKFRHGKIRV